MEHSFDIFEVLPDGGLMWKTAVDGRQKAIIRLHQMATGRPNEFRLLDLDTRSVVATTQENCIPTSTAPTN
jgi:hypothetical protein